MGAVCSGQGDRKKALKLFMEANEIYQDVGDIWLGNTILQEVAWETWDHGDLKKGRTLFEEFSSAKRMAHFKWARDNTLNALIRMNLTPGDYAAAQHFAQENLENLRSTSIDVFEARGQFDLGLVNLSQGEFGPARQRFKSALKIFRKAQHFRRICSTLNYLGLIALYEGRPEDSWALLEESHTIGASLENPCDECVVENLLFLGRVACLQSDFPRAEMLIRQSLERAWNAYMLPMIPSRLEALAEVVAGQAHYQDGAILLGAATQQRHVMGAQIWPVEQPAYNRLLSNLQAALGETAFQQAWDTGMAMTMEQILAYALPDSPS